VFTYRIINQGRFQKKTHMLGTTSIRVSASCVADFVTATGKSRESRLRPFKIPSAESTFRSIYYKDALAAVRAYHARGNDKSQITAAVERIKRLAGLADSAQKRTRYEQNIEAIGAYIRVYGKRRFKVLPNKRLQFAVGNVTVTAQSDLWVEEDGTQVLLKIGMAKKKRQYIDLILVLIRKAAVASGHKIRAKNVVYLNVKSGQEIVASGGLTRFNSLIRMTAAEIEAMWDGIR